jgi:hypothetical protein
MASMQAMRKAAITTLELRRDGRLDAETGERKPSRLANAQAEFDAAKLAETRVAKRVAAATEKLDEIKAEIDAAEKILVATAALAGSDESAPAAESAPAVDEFEDESDDEFDDEDESDDEISDRDGSGRFVSRSA